MTTPERNESDVRRLLQQIDCEYTAASLALTGLALGTSLHSFISARMERIEDAREQLVDIVGPDEATRLVVEQMNTSDVQVEQMKGNKQHGTADE
jgi:hypothetical protein